MNEYLGAILIFVITSFLFYFVFNKHKKIVDRKPNVELGVLQKKKVIKADEVLDTTKVVGILVKQ